MAVTWDVDAQTDPQTIAVRFDCARDENASAWQFFQEHALGVAAPLPMLLRAQSSSSSTDTVSTPALIRTRMLTLPEAFYALTATSHFIAPPALRSHAQIFAHFSQQSPQHFQRHYAVHVHFRSRGWRLKTGLNYGGHYVLYRGAASAFHSEYIVYVRSAEAAAGDALSWGAVQALSRIAADVKKTVLLCDVVTSAASDSSEPADALMPSTRCNINNDVVDETALLTQDTYALYGQHYTVTSTAIRFWDIAAAADAQSLGRSATESSLRFAFQLQPVIRKKSKRPAKTSKRPKTSSAPRAIERRE